MQQFIISSLLVISTVSVFAQSSGIITYKETMKMDFEIDMPEGIDISGMLPESTTSYKDLYFNSTQSAYVDAKANESSDQEIESDDGAVKIMIKMDSNEEIYFTDFNSLTQTHQRSFMGKDFLIEQSLEKPKWKLTGEKVSYLSYECHKAELIIPAQDEDGDESHIVAWFAPSISTQVGPKVYNALPGAILMLSVNGDHHEYMATEVVFDTDNSEKLIKPTKGKVVTAAEYTKIIQEKKLEMKEMSGGAIFNRH